jgi:hypothetical protein
MMRVCFSERIAAKLGHDLGQSWMKHGHLKLLGFHDRLMGRTVVEEIVVEDLPKQGRQTQFLRLAVALERIVALLDMLVVFVFLLV